MKKFLEILGVTAVSLLAGAYLHKCQNPQQTHPQEPPAVVVVDTVTYVDTIPYISPAPKQEISLGNKITFLPVFIRQDSVSSNILRDTERQSRLPQEGNIAAINIPSPSMEHLTDSDSVAVVIPITQREYEDEEYHAWVSGYDPKLDSLFVFPQHEIVTIREPPNKPKRWGIGVFAGYGITPHGFQPCAGISINYNLWNF